MQQGPGPGGPQFGYDQNQGPNPWAAKAAEDAVKAKKLVSLSRWLLLGGCAVMFGGCGGGIALQFGPLAIGGSIVGILVIIAASIVGSVGRGMQGRII